MKRCPTCKREFEDSITYCPDDGSPLVSQSRPDSDETLVTPSIRDRDIPTTQYGQPGGKANVSSSIADWPGLPPYAATPAKRQVWPWVVAGLAILFLLFGIVIAAVIAIPKIVNRPKPAVATESPSSSVPDTRTPSEPSSATGAPTDEKVVLSQLTELEKQWTVANLEADKDALKQILADDYRGVILPQQTGVPRRDKAGCNCEVVGVPGPAAWPGGRPSDAGWLLTSGDDSRHRSL